VIKLYCANQLKPVAGGQTTTGKVGVGTVVLVAVAVGVFVTTGVAVFGTLVAVGVTTTLSQ
jgi:hypothetical protein